MKIHLRISAFDKIRPDKCLCKKINLCQKKDEWIEKGYWTWNKKEVTCKKCLKKLSKGVFFMQRRKSVYIDENKKLKK